MYHGIDSSAIPLSQFRKQMILLKREFRVIAMSELEHEPCGTGREVVLTFDDGLRNFVTSAYPVLADLGLPATIFICPGLVERGEWQWTHITRQRLVRFGPDLLSSIARDLGCAASADAIVESLKSMESRDRTRVVQLVGRKAGAFRPTQSERDAFDVLTVADLASLDRELVTIGSHTMDHDLLPGMSPGAARADLAHSRDWIQRQVGAECRYFSYPNGATSGTVRDAVRDVYQLAVGTDPGFIPVSQQHLPRYELPRVGVGPSVSDMAWRLHRP